MPRRVRSADGTEIALYEYGNPAAPVLAVSPDGDAFVTTPLQTDVARWAPNLTCR